MIQSQKTFLRLLFLLTTTPGLLLAQDRSANIDVNEIVKKVDALYRSESSVSEMEMQIVRPYGEKTLRLKAWTKGLDSTVIRIISPAAEQGINTLRLGSEMWDYRPGSNRIIKVPSATMMSPWMDSDFTYDDLVGKFTLFEDFHCKLLIPPEIGVNQLYVSSIPKEGRASVWGEIIMAVRREDYQPLWKKYYDKQGNFVRMLNFYDFKAFGQHTVPATMEMIPQTPEGRKTVLRYLTLAFGHEIDEEIFNLGNRQAMN